MDKPTKLKGENIFDFLIIKTFKKVSLITLKFEKVPFFHFNIEKLKKVKNDKIVKKHAKFNSFLKPKIFFLRNVRI